MVSCLLVVVGGGGGGGVTVARRACTPLISRLEKRTVGMRREPARKKDSASDWFAVRKMTDSSRGSLMQPRARIM